jgi:threonine dehydrogenase-like Zn-dependent dehydrogenase
MKSLALRVYGKKDARLETVDVPRPGRGQVLLKTRACGVCTTDRDVYLEGSLLDPRYTPVTLGHEASLSVVEVGPEVPGDKEFFPITAGDVVAAEDIEGCHRCFYCNRGLTNICKDARYPGITSEGWDCVYQLAPWHILHKVLPGLSDDAIACIEPASGALHAIKRGGVKLGDIVVVLGCGPIGLFQLQAARAAGAEVVAVDPVGRKLAVAKSLGADHAIDPNETNVEKYVREISYGLGADVVLEAAGLPGTYQDAIRISRKGGKVVAMGIVTVPSVPLDLGTSRGVTINEVSIIGQNGHGLWPDSWADFRVVMKLMKSKKISIEGVVTHHLPLSDWKVALEMSPEDRIKVIFNKFDS